MVENEISEIILDCCFIIHRRLGPGLLESVYEEILAYELSMKNMSFEKQKEIPLLYNRLNFGVAFRVDYRMLLKVQSSAVHCIDAFPVEVETHMEGNVPSFQLVGLPDSVVRESRERVISAIKNSGFTFSFNRLITINLAPADLKKAGSSNDLPIAVGILSAQGYISEEKLGRILLSSVNWPWTGP